MFSKWTIEPNQNQSGSTILFPGFATDYRIWKYGDTRNYPHHFEYLGHLAYPNDYSSTSLTEFKAILEKIPRPIHIVGISLGGFIAVNLLNNYPNSIDKITLLGVRQYYPKKDLDMVRKLIKRDTKAYLKSFYRISFVNKLAYQSFKDNLEYKYLQKFTIDTLLQDIDHLERLQINTTLCTELPKLQFIHGDRDAVAPLLEVDALHQSLPHSKIDIKIQRGHLDII